MKLFSIFCTFCTSLNLLFLSSCTKWNGWHYSEVSCASQLSHPSPSLMNGVVLEFQEGCYGRLGYVSVCGGKIPASADYPSYTPVTCYLGETNRSFYGYLEQGEQRILLPEEATTLIYNALAEGECVGVAITGRYSKFQPEDFCKYCKSGS